MRRVFWWYGCLATAGAVAYPFVSGPWKDALYLTASLGVIAAVLWGVRLHRPATRAPWLLLAGGLFCSLIGDIGSYVYTWVQFTEPPFPSFLDGFYLLFYPCVYAAMGSFLKASGRRDPAAWVDAGIWTIGATLLLWEPLIEPYMVQGQASYLAYVIGLGYPLLDLGLLLLVLRIVAGRASINPAYLLLTSALLIQIVVDWIYGVRVVHDAYAVGELTDVGWLVVNLMLGAAALHPSMTRLTEPASRKSSHSSQFRLQALLIPALAAPALLLYEVLSGDGTDQRPDGIFLAAAITLLLVLVVGRGGGLLKLADRRSEQLSQRTEALESALNDRETVGRELRALVDRDALTGLASRDRFVERLRIDLDAWRSGEQGPSIAFLDLDDFKSVNDTLGHEAGDVLLIEIARRMQATLGSGELAARFGGDEFAVLLTGDAEAMAENLLAAMEEPFLLQGRELRPQVSIGLASARVRPCSSSELLREADVAMYEAKRSGGSKWVRYQPDMSVVLVERLDLRNRLDNALAAGEIQAWYQPLVDLASGQLLGFEALARWSVDRDPQEWLAFAEESGLIVEVDRVVFLAAVEQLATWRREVPDTQLELAVNLSAHTLSQPGIEDEVLEALVLNGVPAHRLIVEVTEGVLIDEIEISERLLRLRAAGVRIGLDDFGTGGASLSYLRRFPVDHLKLDRTLIEDLGLTPEGSAIPAAVAHLAQGLSLGLVAEGVETIDQCERLVALGFRVGQGYLFGRAQPAAQVTRRVLRSGPMIELPEEVERIWVG